MTTLHILNASPAQTTQLSSCLRVLSAGDSILLCGEAVQALRAGSAAAELLHGCDRTFQLYALEEDVHARAIAIDHIQITLLDYPAFVALSINCTRVNSWT